MPLPMTVSFARSRLQSAISKGIGSSACHRLTISGPKTTLQGDPELQLRDRNKIVFLVQSWIENQMNTWCNPHIIGETHSPVHLQSILVTYRFLKDLFNGVHVEETDCRFAMYVERIQIDSPGGQSVFGKGSGDATSAGGIVGESSEPAL